MDGERTRVHPPLAESEARELISPTTTEYTESHGVFFILRILSSRTERSVVKDLEGTKERIHVDVSEILRRYAPLDDNKEGNDKQ